MVIQTLLDPKPNRKARSGERVSTRSDGLNHLSRNFFSDAVILLSSVGFFSVQNQCGLPKPGGPNTHDYLQLQLEVAVEATEGGRFPLGDHP